MKFGIDLDGVLGNFASEVVKVGNTLWPGKFPPGYVPDNWNYEGYLSDAEWATVWNTIKATPYFWENESSLAGVNELQQALRADDEVFYITARQNTVGEPAAVQSARWLHHRFLWPRSGYSTLLQVEEPKHKQDFFPALKLKFMLDDYAPTVEQLNAIEGMHAFVFDQPWNRYAVDLPRVKSVTEYLEKVRALSK